MNSLLNLGNNLPSFGELPRPRVGKTCRTATATSPNAGKVCRTATAPNPNAGKLAALLRRGKNKEKEVSNSMDPS